MITAFFARSDRSIFIIVVKCGMNDVPGFNTVQTVIREGQATNLAVFYFFIFYFSFLLKYIFVFEIYRNIPRLLFLQKFSLRPWRTGRPAPQAARQRGDRLPEATGPSLLHQKFRKKTLDLS